MTATVLGTLGAVVPAATGHAAPTAQLVYIANMRDNSVTAYDPATGAVAATIPVGTTPEGVAFSPDGTRVYVTNNGSDSVSVIDTATNTVTATIPVGRAPQPVAFSPDGSHAYVAHGAGGVDVIDTAGLAVTATIPVGSLPTSVALTPDGSMALVGNFGSNSVSLIDTAGNTVALTIGQPNGARNPAGLAITPDGTRAYVTNYNTANVSVIDLLASLIVATVPVGSLPMGVAVTPDGQYAYIANLGSGSVSVLSVATNTVVATVPVGIRPMAVAVDPAGGSVYVSNNTSNTVSVIDTATNTVTATVAAGTGPFGLAVGKPVPPAVTGISPGHGPVAGGTTVTITGSRLTGTSEVTFGGAPASDVKVVDASTVTVTAPPHAAGAVDVALTVSGRTVAAGQYTYDVPAPAVTAVAPDHGPLAGGTVVTLTGTDLTGATAVTFGGTAATAFTVDSDTRITATVPAAATAGKADVIVTTPAGTSTAQQYTYEAPAPVVAYVFSKSADPKSGSAVKSGDKVTYSVTVTQQGADEVKGATVNDDLSKVLDDATYNGDVKATSGTAEVKDGKLTWSGDLPVGGSATITYSVSVSGSGDKQLHNVVTTSDDKRGRCATEKGCETDHTVTAGSTPSPSPTSTSSPSPTPTSTGGGQTPGPGASSQAPVAPQAPAAPAASTPRQPSGTLASTGATVLTTATVSGALLILGGLTVAFSRRRSRQS
ncbi:IPT/TIG domain-containing protein [Kitasatospora sp. NPDC057692]|uniref:IPT/TIG domain-containing protein n=1 Tax=Kitasatospora sp. NPDC057692 TaxID=3346215 RepID=UPI0036B458A3